MPSLSRNVVPSARRLPAALLAALVLASGCGALHPIKGVPASYLPLEYLGPSRDGLRPINPMLLTRSRPGEHLVDAGDVLTIYIPGILGTVSTDLHTIGEFPPINYPQDPEMPPTIGFPVTVRGDGTISLPQVPPIPVRGMTVGQVEETVRLAYTTPRQILPAGKERVLVSLQRPREYRVLVVREDTGFTTDQSGFGTINLGQSRRGTARIVSLRAYENDVLHALARGQGADGLPGLDAEGAVYVIRRRSRASGPDMPVDGGACGAGGPWFAPAGAGAPPMGGAPVVRFQSPDGDYRSGGAASYSGHSVMGAPPAAAPSGRYGSGPAMDPRIAAAPPAMYAAGSSGGRYGGVTPSPAMPGPAMSAMAMPATTSAPHQPWGVGAPPPVMSDRYAPAGPVPQMAAAPLSTSPQAWPTYPQPLPAAQAHPMMPHSMPHSMPPGAPLSPIPAAPLGPMPPGGVGWSGYPAPGVIDSPVPLPVMGGGEHETYFQTMLGSGITGTIDGPGVVRIPIRVLPHETPRIRECDVTLEDGDIVFIEARDSEVFYTGGLLGGGQYTLPRDHDLRALEAVSIAQASGPRGGSTKSVGGVSALNQDVTISASKLIVVRKRPDGSSLPIEVDLNRAKQDMTGRENIVIQPGDYLYLQYSCVEAVGAFFERHLLEGALFGVAAAQFSTDSN
jgi:hypothetical protein